MLSCLAQFLVPAGRYLVIVVVYSFKMFSGRLYKLFRFGCYALRCKDMTRSNKTALTFKVTIYADLRPSSPLLYLRIPRELRNW